MKSHLRTTARHIIRAPYQAVAAIGTTTLTFFLAGIFSIVAVGSAALLNYFETRPQISAFFKNDVKENIVSQVQQRLMDSGLTSEVKYISQEEALTIYREQNKHDPQLLEMVTASILPASLEIRAKDTPSLKELANLLKTEPSVEEVIFQEDIINSLTKWTNSIKLVGSILVIAFAVLTLVIIVVIVGMKIAMKKDEIEILHLIGATRGYIQTPFLLEGMFYGAFGGFAAGVLAITALLYSTSFLVDFLVGIPLLPIPMWFYFALLASEIILGAFLGLFGSLVSVKRYLK